jgi:hypothetical protein
MAGLKEKEADVRVMEPHKANNTVDTDIPFFQALQFSQGRLTETNKSGK